MPKKTVNKTGALALPQALCIFYWFFELNDKPILYIMAVVVVIPIALVWMQGKT